jgi:hypothetical protein
MGGPCTVDGQVRKELDNFHQCQIEHDGAIWSSSEHVYQASKYPQHKQQREDIRTAPSGMQSWQLGQTSTDALRLRSDWEEVKVEMMYMANLAKFKQNPSLREVLVNSVGPIEAQGGLFWKTWNEVLLERIREELRSANSRDCAVLAQRIFAMAAYRAAAQGKDQYSIDVTTTYASKRMPIPSLSSYAVKSLAIAGAGDEFDGTYHVDLMVPEVNGCPHFINCEKGHLCLGIKNERRAWVLDECLSPDEASGGAFLPVHGESTIPIGELLWQVFDGVRHIERIVSVQIDTSP